MKKNQEYTADALNRTGISSAPARYEQVASTTTSSAPTT